MASPAHEGHFRHFGRACAAVLLLVGLPACSGSGGGGGGPTSPGASTREICGMNAETGELVALVIEFLSGSTPPLEAPSGCARVSTNAGMLRLDAAGFWIRTVDASESPEGGDRFALVPGEMALTNRLVPYLTNGLMRSAGERLPDETKIRQTAEVLLGTDSDEVAIRAALMSVTRLGDGQLDVPTVRIVGSAAEFADGAGFPNFSPKAATEIEEYYLSNGFTAGAKIAYESGQFRLDRELTHLLWHVYLNPTDNHTDGGVGSLASKEFDALDDRTFAILYRLALGSTPATYGLGGEVGSGPG